MSSGADAEQIERLSRLGDNVGTAFQVSDDIIDITSVAGDSGKNPGTDLREGVHTLPVLYALADPTETRIRELVLNPDGTNRPITDDAEVAEALDLLNSSDGLVRARATLQSYADAADAELAQLPAGPAHDAMSSLVRYTIARVG
jgi:heptaprenyl diphosphate synthase